MRAVSWLGSARSAARVLEAALAGVLVSPAMAFAAERVSGELAEKASGVLEAKNIWFVAGGGLIGWLGKLLADNINGRMTERRDFIAQTTGQITTLAREHYWALANNAGVLAGMLEEYLSFVDFHLLLEWDNPGDLSSRLEKIADDYCSQTFYKLCRLICLFNKFQFEQSNTYLLTSDIAGRSCRQLYNSFLTSLLGSEGNTAARMDMLAILDVMNRPIAVSGRNDPVSGAELTEAEFNGLLADGDGDQAALGTTAGDPRLAKLRAAKGAYLDWLAGQLDHVCIAAQSLRA
jgi:hypothetical protein